MRIKNQNRSRVSRLKYRNIFHEKFIKYLALLIDKVDLQKRNSTLRYMFAALSFRK